MRWNSRTGARLRATGVRAAADSLPAVTAELLAPGALDGRALAVHGACATACAAGGRALVRPGRDEPIETRVGDYFAGCRLALQ